MRSQRANVRARYWHWSTCGGSTLYAPARRKLCVELPAEDYQPGDEHKCGLLRYSLYGTRDAAQNWEEELASTLSGLGLKRRSACPCVWRGRIKGEDVVATVHGDDITIGGQWTALEFFIKMISKKYEIRKQDGIAIEADLRHVREKMKGLELERANHSATPRAVERRDESKGKNPCGRGQTKRRWDDVNDDDNRDRPRMADDDAIDSQALTGGDITRYGALVARISYLLCDGKTIDAGHGMRQENWQVPRLQAKSDVLVPLATGW